jgi:uncharacterized membrane protein (UPF0127 family)
MFCSIALALVVAAVPAALPTPQSLPVRIVSAPKAMLHLQVATTEQQRERGLMSVRRLAPHTGMLFVFDTDMPIAFWMKDTLIPLDMIFIAADGTVRKVFVRVPVVPADLPDQNIPLERGTAKYVIELPAGEAPLDGLQPGAHLRGLPRVGNAGAP